MFKNVLIITDNLYLYKNFKKIVKNCKFKNTSFSYRFSYLNKDFLKRFSKNKSFKKINVKKEYKNIIKNFDLVFSLHSKSLFPKELVSSIKCINIHPGYNPYNRGWFPQVFSIINKKPLGATIHEIDEKIDNGLIIDQKKVIINSWDTSLSSYNKVIKAELKLINKNIKKIINNKYKKIKTTKNGNLNMISDFKKLCEIKLNKKDSFKNFIDILRALSHDNFKNAYFIDKKTGKKIFINITLTPDE